MNSPKYTGEFHDNKLHGHGVLTWSNGETFSGQFTRNCPEKGVLEKPGQSNKVRRVVPIFVRMNFMNHDLHT